jgi:hypothetical protein
VLLPGWSRWSCPIYKNTFREAPDLSFIVAHANHGFRPEESERKTDLAQKESARLDLPLELIAISPRGSPRHSLLNGTTRSLRVQAIIPIGAAPSGIKPLPASSIEDG